MSDFDIKDKYLGETVSVSISVVDTEGAATDASSVTYSVRYPDGTLAVDDTAATHGATGQYTIDYTLPSETTGQVGKYMLSVKITGASGNVDIKKTSFNVEASI
jgi:phage baseplate assembly protein gpV